MGTRSRPPRSLQAKALQLLAQREQSGAELRRKLIAHDRATDRAVAVESARGEGALDGARHAILQPWTVLGDAIAADEVLTVDARVDAVMAWLETHRFASDERFAESRIHARQARFGNLRIRQELATHSIALSADAAQRLTETELQRAVAVCARKFAAPPVGATESARQGRFLIARGFSPDVVRQALRWRTKRGPFAEDADPLPSLEDT